MAHIIDYLDWRGDLPFAVSPFNEVDNYILCKLGELDYSDVLPPGQTMTVSQLPDTVFADGREPLLGLLSSSQLIPLLKRLPETRRFRNLRLSGFVNCVDPEQNEQFSALTITLPNATRFVSFRGTDDTIVAWKEDFLLSVEDVIAAQRDALDYLLQTAETPGSLIVGGHSKGGNAAVYAAMAAPPAVQDRILAVYNNDGPGFRENMLVRPAYLRIRPKVHTLVSQHSMVGKLLCHETNFQIIRSDRAWISAHDALNWQVLGTKFVRCEDFAAPSKAFEAALTDLQARMNQEERQQFINALFDILTSTGAVTLTDLTEHRLRQALLMARELRQAPEVYRFMLSLAGLTTKKTWESARDALSSPTQLYHRFRKNKPD
ncbi:MAG: Mbeg1-like protein [Oscillospiraceae bacterium]|nr:Mbeg1-like protein [Oscillospiraceae bacterium]